MAEKDLNEAQFEVSRVEFLKLLFGIGGAEVDRRHLEELGLYRA